MTELRDPRIKASHETIAKAWPLDPCGRSLLDLAVTLKELSELGVGSVSLTEALDLNRPTGRALARLLSVFAEFEHEILRGRIRAGITEAAEGKTLRAAADRGQEDWPDPGAIPRRRQQCADRVN